MISRQSRRLVDGYVGQEGLCGFGWEGGEQVTVRFVLCWGMGRGDSLCVGARSRVVSVRQRDT